MSTAAEPWSFGRLFALKLLNLMPLALKLALLILDLTLLLSRGDFLVLERIADHVAGARTQGATNRRTHARSAHGGTDNSARARAEYATAYRPLLASR
jgi:hypothetical protein